MTRGLLIAAPSSGAGKTTVTLGVLRAFARRGVAVASGKSGPDYIDPAFHAAATGHPCVSLDPWCAGAAQVRARAAIMLKRFPAEPERFGVAKTRPDNNPEASVELLVVEGAMGLFDGAPSPDSPLGRGSSADVAAALGVPVVLVVDAGRTAQTVAAVVAGLATWRADVRVAGVILNRVGSARHEAMLRAAVSTVCPVLGALRRDEGLATPSRHLGLVQASERGDLAAFLDRAADAVEAGCDLDAICALAEPVAAGGEPVRLSPLGQRVAVACDTAFGFAYPHMLADWRAAGAEVVPFSPLADEGPDGAADAVFLPGGYPELHAGRLAAASGFAAGMLAARVRGAVIYGECGGYMTLGRGIVDAEGMRHGMLGFLGVETSFAERRLHLGYRRLVGGETFLGHDFHYASTLSEVGEPLFRAYDAMGDDLGDCGLREGVVSGSFAHIVERA